MPKMFESLSTRGWRPCCRADGDEDDSLTRKAEYNGPRPAEVVDGISTLLWNLFEDSLKQTVGWFCSSHTASSVMLSHRFSLASYLPKDNNSQTPCVLPTMRELTRPNFWTMLATVALWVSPSLRRSTHRLWAWMGFPESSGCRNLHLKAFGR